MFGYYSKTSYEGKLREWKFRKHMTSKDWKYVSRCERKHKNQKQPTEVYFNGSLVEAQKVRKELSRHIRPSLLEEVARCMYYTFLSGSILD